jgi:hypothetical protein
MNTDCRYQTRLAVLPAVIALALFAALPAAAQDAAATAAAPAAEEDQPVETVLRFDSAISPEARSAMERMKAALNNLQRASVTAEVSRDEALTYGYKLQHNEFVKMDIDRPTKLRVDVSGDIKNRTYYYDGSEFIVLAKDLNVYAKKPVAGTIGELVQMLLDRGVDMPLIDMLYDGQAGDLLDDVRVGIVVGDATIDGEQVTHLAFRQPDVDWQLWLSKANSLPRKIAITTRYSVGDPQYQAVLRWNTAPKFAANTFKFTPAPGVTLIKMNEPAVASSGGEK